uniref:Putative Phosphatidylinositol alpha-mannosyltransferase n=1 Tax=Rubrivivax gelatinosus S1 TaxID=1138313 RepID=L8BAP3_RUBGE|nr:putative Phosphatidylinositol alpha-mannosyltransferase [Rubrivivax gelatinosus S1]
MHSVCLISDDFLPAATGVGTHVQQIATDLAALGHRVSIITTRRPGEPQEDSWRGVTVHRCFTLKVFGFYQALPSQATIEQILRRHQVDIVHLHYLGILLKRSEATARRMGLPCVYTYHMTADHLSQPALLKPLRPWFRRQIEALCRRMDLVISPSLALAKTVRTGATGAAARYISNPVAFGSSTGVVPAPRPAGFVVLFAGRLNPEKNLPLLLRAFEQLLQTQPDACLWVAGLGDQKPLLESLARSLGIAAKVHFLGFIARDELARHYLACDVFVLPSTVEVQPLVAMEAMHFGRPVILTRAIVSAAELVDDGVNGYTVDPEDAGELATRLRTLAADPALRQRMGEEARRRSSAFEPATVAAALTSAYDDVTGRGAGRG